jgi:transposase
MSRRSCQSETGKSNSPKGQLLTPFQRKLLQKSLSDNLPEKYRQRIQIMLLADEGKTQLKICKALGCSQETARHWIFTAKAGLAHTWNDNPIGRPKTVSDQHLELLKKLASNSPRDFGYPFQRWTAQWLSKHLAKECGVEISARHINRLLKEMGLSTRPKPAAAEDTAQQTGTRLAIRDLTGDCGPDTDLWLFNSIS